jgi:hypothetical protein
VKKHIDEFAKSLASGVPSRRAFGKLIIGLGGMLFLGKTASASGNNMCVEFCRAQHLHEDDFGHCVAASAQCPDGECAVIINTGRSFCVPIG